MPTALKRRAWPAAAGGVAAGLALLGVFVLPAPSQQGAASPRDALTLVRQALAALEVSPPNVGVAAERVIKALFAQDTRGVDMPRLRDAQQALYNEDPAAAAAYLMEALRPSDAGPAGVDPTLLTPVRPRFGAVPAAYGLLAVAALLMCAGGLIVR